MKIISINRQKDLRICAPFVRSVVRSVLEQEKTCCKEVTIYFVTERRICALHEQFFQDPTPTDCISFPMDQDFLGEVFVCPRTALLYVEQKGGDPYQEVALYIIHGVLHLLGYDDTTPNQRRIMRKKEKACMDRFLTKKRSEKTCALTKQKPSTKRSRKTPSL